MTAGAPAERTCSQHGTGTFWPSLAQLVPAAYCVGLALGEQVRLDVVAEQLLLQPAERAAEAVEVMLSCRPRSPAGSGF